MTAAASVIAHAIRHDHKVRELKRSRRRSLAQLVRERPVYAGVLDPGDFDNAIAAIQRQLALQARAATRRVTTRNLHRRPVTRAARPIGCRRATRPTATSTGDPDPEPPRPRAPCSSTGGAS